MSNARSEFKTHGLYMDRGLTIMPLAAFEIVQRARQTVPAIS